MNQATCHFHQARIVDDISMKRLFDAEPEMHALRIREEVEGLKNQASADALTESSLAFSANFIRWIRKKPKCRTLQFPLVCLATHVYPDDSIWRSSTRSYRAQLLPPNGIQAHGKSHPFPTRPRVGAQRSHGTASCLGWALKKMVDPSMCVCVFFIMKSALSEMAGKPTE